MKLEAYTEQPFESLIAILCILSGGPLLFGAPPPVSAANQLPGWIVRGWGGVLLFGGLCVFAGITTRLKEHQFVTGLYIERAGYLPLIAGTQVFAAVIAISAGWRALFPIMTYIIFGIACGLRSRNITKVTKAIRKANEYGR